MVQMKKKSNLSEGFSNFNTPSLYYIYVQYIKAIFSYKHSIIWKDVRGLAEHKESLLLDK